MTSATVTSATVTSAAVAPAAVTEQALVPFHDLRDLHALDGVQEELDAAVLRVTRSGRYLLGAELAAFEEEFARYCENAHCVGLGSGLDALELTLRALGIGEGDEVVVPGHTFIATWLAVSATGARPVPVEPEPDSFLIDPGRLEAAITPRTKAVMPVHTYGHPVDLDAIDAVTAPRGIPVVEDAAQAHGARYREAGASAPATRRRSASTRARTWARWATAAPSSPPTGSWRSGSGCCATTARARSTGTRRAAPTPVWTRSRRRRCA